MSKPSESFNNIIVPGSTETGQLYGKYLAGKPGDTFSDFNNDKSDVLSSRDGVESSSNNIMILCSKETAALYQKYLVKD